MATYSSKDLRAALYALEREQFRQREAAEPLTVEDCHRRNIDPEATLLHLMVVDGDPMKLAKTLPPLYDAYGWWITKMPPRRLLREYVTLAVRRRGYRQVGKKPIDKIVNAIISRVRARGVPPEDHRDCVTCDCHMCRARNRKLMEQLHG